MKVFVFEMLKKGAWKPWFVEQCDFRKALWQINTEQDIQVHRIRRVKTLTELEGYIEDKDITVRRLKIIENWLWKVEWIS